MPDMRKQYKTIIKDEDPDKWSAEILDEQGNLKMIIARKDDEYYFFDSKGQIFRTLSSAQFIQEYPEFVSPKYLANIAEGGQVTTFLHESHMHKKSSSLQHKDGLKKGEANIPIYGEYTGNGDEMVVDMSDILHAIREDKGQHKNVEAAFLRNMYEREPSPDPAS